VFLRGQQAAPKVYGESMCGGAMLHSLRPFGKRFLIAVVPSPHAQPPQKFFSG
jgi:hypothetical protein